MGSQTSRCVDVDQVDSTNNIQQTGAGDGNDSTGGGCVTDRALEFFADCSCSINNSTTPDLKSQQRRLDLLNEHTKQNGQSDISVVGQAHERIYHSKETIGSNNEFGGDDIFQGIGELHSPSPPFLGTTYWDSYSDHDDDDYETSSNASSYTRSPLTYPAQCVNMKTSSMSQDNDNYDQEIMIQGVSNLDGISTPRIRSAGESSHLSCSSTIRTSTTVSSDTKECSNLVHTDGSFDEGDESTPSTNSQKKRNNNVVVSFTPRNLFDEASQHSDHDRNSIMADEEEEDKDGEEDYNFLNPTVSHATAVEEVSSRPKAAHPINSNFESPSFLGCCQMSFSPGGGKRNSIVVRDGVLTSIPTPPISPSFRTSSELSSATAWHLPDGAHRAGSKRVNTLPSMIEGQPIKLKVTERYTGFLNVNDSTTAAYEGGSNNISTYEENSHLFSYDPYFSSGRYEISKPPGEDYGNGLHIEMGSQFMTLADSNGRVYATARSRHTFVPSFIIYAPRPRFPGQTASTHTTTMEADDVELYPWAYVKKEGRRMDHDVTLHLVSSKEEKNLFTQNNISSNKNMRGTFSKEPYIRAQHCFDSQHSHSHTKVYRETANNEEGTSEEDRLLPCCILVRDSTDQDSFGVTIAPGIDPLLIIMYLAVHFKMDVEPKLSDQ
mmetsp:Transcript_15346/g.21901  ORF Transcript_15346/g.21901 Transcript_15346/m.21901 type:complete len:662 (+) Transcript_15346:386-2371(+)|eukprot:CAMPEP_0184864216 /NCGR_PEP_ID=MMETSP0580-20130426/14135_1 /TAXON_ID=1118495 /ORGANISM="Dactyliosolen fragilissimus" /LENGTH=661 /DNA_ID=CAMNT_0027362909 /DNA_START=309 /DNA_END=2294 /DNA_ORIENTATION=+